MKKLILLSVMFMSQVTFASGNHYHPKQILKCAGECTEAQIRGVIPQSIDTLIKAKEVREAWRNIPVEKVYKKQFKKGQEWVVEFFDKAQTDSNRQRLYMFISLDGWLNGANNTGN